MKITPIRAKYLQNVCIHIQWQMLWKVKYFVHIQMLECQRLYCSFSFFSSYFSWRKKVKEKGQSNCRINGSKFHTFTFFNAICTELYIPGFKFLIYVLFSLVYMFTTCNTFVVILIMYISLYSNIVHYTI